MGGVYGLVEGEFYCPDCKKQTNHSTSYESEAPDELGVKCKGCGLERTMR